MSPRTFYMTLVLCGLGASVAARADFQTTVNGQNGFSLSTAGGAKAFVVTGSTQSNNVLVQTSAAGAPVTLGLADTSDLYASRTPAGASLVTAGSTSTVSTGRIDWRAILTSFSVTWNGMGCAISGTRAYAGAQEPQATASIQTKLENLIVSPSTATCDASTVGSYNALGTTESETCMMGSTCRICWYGVTMNIALVGKQADAQQYCTITPGMGSCSYACTREMAEANGMREGEVRTVYAPVVAR